MKKPVSRAYLRHVRRTLLAIKTGRQGGRRETRSRHGRTGHRRAARATWTQAEEDAPGICVLRRPSPRFTSRAHRQSADLAISGTPSMVVRLCSYPARTAERVVLVAVPRGRVGRADRRRLRIRTPPTPAGSRSAMRNAGVRSSRVSITGCRRGIARDPHPRRSDFVERRTGFGSPTRYMATGHRC